MTRERKWQGAARGVAAMQAAVVSSILGVGVAALAIDSGFMFHSRAELQNVADAAALAAAMELGDGSSAALAAARVQAAAYAERNQVAANGATINPQSDVTFGHATFNNSTGKYDFSPNVQPYDAVQVFARRETGSADGQVSLLFARIFGLQGANVNASAVAMLVPRDISVAIDLSGSMNDDSELRHYQTFPSESGGTRPGVQINLKDIWTNLALSEGRPGTRNGANPSSPGSSCAANDPQPSNGSSTPHAVGGNPQPNEEPSGGATPTGPRWGWMTDWGTAVTLGSYDPTTDFGLYYIPRNTTCTNSDVIENLTTSGYSSAERTALLSSANDSNSTRYQNRVKVLLGLNGWKSGKSGGKYTGTGNGDNIVDSSELTHSVSWTFAGGSWTDYITYVMSNTNRMYETDSDFRYRYGLKTVVNYLLESNSQHDEAPELAATPELPLFTVKSAVQVLVDTVTALQSQDQLSLEIFAQTGRHEVNLTQTYQNVPNRLNQMQSAHYDSVTNIGGGLDTAITELESSRARSAAKKVIIILTDGKPNVDQNDDYVGDGDDDAVEWCLERATYAADHGMTIYTIAVGGDADREITQQIAAIGNGLEFFAGDSPDEYTAQLQQIFQNLGGRRTVQLIK